MTVSRILTTKGRDVVTIQPHRTLSEASRLLGERRIGAVVVTGADGDVLGILSERDIVRALGKRGAEALNDAVSAHMTAEVITCAPDMVIVDIMEEMTARRFRHMPVVENGRLAGIISIGDVVKFRLNEMQYETEALREYISAG
ncbi:inosine-5-monophosphate dehydrogenase [Alsobacter soli]|uniref:Inosine-5-monophosphate dehydrogenase n=1 Tax=Alsobacter soli TaxID=2109933 RepID=A0A2T1HRV9_9HYPH|nr:CBS domain-containing protein [Alsobacter soli]PSC04394.1 inosine-5-monophosphate dehydrogenase [Alsobacter soli]